MAILKFYKPGCEPCRALGQIMTLLTIPIDVVEINILDESNKDLLVKYNIKAVPVLVNTDNGEKLTGVKPTDVIEDWYKLNETD